jgi:ribosomal protein S18 acetylase RimI-like enzyme
VTEDDFNLEDEYGGLLDLIEENISGLRGTSLEHHGVKGMKWGVRKDRTKSAREPLKSLGPDSVSRKTASGETITLQKVKPNQLSKFLGRMSKKYREGYSKQAQLDILDGQGKKVGDANVEKKNNDELYLNWLGIDKSARGKGYATAVMQAGRDFGKQQGFKRMTLEVPGNSPDARHIYEKLGFKVVKEGNPAEDPIWGGLTDMVYEFDAAHSLIRHADGRVMFPRKIGVDKLIIDKGKQLYSGIKDPEAVKRSQSLLRHMGLG